MYKSWSIEELRDALNELIYTADTVDTADTADRQSRNVIMYDIQAIQKELNKR